jgi:hypothetical protein
MILKVTMDENGWDFQITDECACPDNQFWFENHKKKGACVPKHGDGQTGILL